MMALILLFWSLFGILALAPACFIFLYMIRSSRKPWPTKVDSNYQPYVSVLVPTYNESNTILLKLANLARVTYPRELMEVVVVDSNSSDSTVNTVKQFSEKEPQLNLRVLVEEERKGKSHALNWALDNCKGDVIVVSDADCFWPSDVLEKSIPFLADPSVGAIGGPKVLLNADTTWVTKMETSYMKSANTLRFGESKAGSTLFGEGGFGAFKREAFDRFDPYCTGSDDCGTIINVIAKDFRSMLVPEAKFFSAFPESYRGKMAVKLRRTNQLVRVFGKYLNLLFRRKLNRNNLVIIPNILLYMISPFAFLLLIPLSIILFWTYPLSLIILVLLLSSRVRFYFFQICESNILLFASICSILTGRRFSIWSQPDDRTLFTQEILRQFNLI